MIMTSLISIIIPTLNESARIVRTLETLRAQAPETELLVADGGSTDDTARLAAPFCRVIAVDRGRAVQMNRGAQESRGEWLLFLHADTSLPAAFEREIAQARDGGHGAGAFRLRIKGRHPLLPLLGWGATWRTRLLGVALGDQALFCRRDVFQEMGGFPEIPIMEDYLFSLRLRESGRRLYLARTAVETSGRRWDEQGFWRTWWKHRMFYRRFHGRGDLAGMSREYPNAR